MKICGQYFRKKEIQHIETIIEKEPEISRRSLSKRICEFLNWRSPNGKVQEMSCRKALSKLQRKGIIRLPEKGNEYSFNRPAVNKEELFSELPEVCCCLEEAGEIEIVPIFSRDSKESKIWNELMSKYHYLGNGPLCGAQMRYLIKSSRYGWLGGFSFSGGVWHLEARDKWIGWSESARRANLRKIIYNSRFLILPSVKIKNLASFAISSSLSRLPKDWSNRYGYEPVLVETFVDSRRFKGTCYRAGNWIHLGQTRSRSTPHINGKKSDGQKEIYVYPLVKKWKEVLNLEPIRRLCEVPGIDNPKDWVEEEFGRVEFYDNRLKERLYAIARNFSAQPGALIPQACSGLVKNIKGAYRFFSNREVNMNRLLKPHTESTIERIRKEKVVLAVQDTTTLNYTNHPAMEGIGPTNGKKHKAVGLILHDTMAFTAGGTPLGLLDVQCWGRKKEEAGKSEKRNKLPIEEKESIKWLNSYRKATDIQQLCPETMIVSVGDREADIYEFFTETLKSPFCPKLLVRADRHKKRRAEEINLWKKMEQEPISGYLEIEVPRKGSRPARKARLTVRHAEVTLSAPKGKDLPPVKMWAVYTREENYSPEVKTPLEWMLLTTIETRTFEEACEKISWYKCRWNIEVYHRTIKSGCRIEDRRLDDADSMEACLAIDLVIGWRVYWLTKLGRETPGIPCNAFLKEEEIQVLSAIVAKTKLSKEFLSIRDAIRIIASLGGFIGRKGDGEPGTTTIWRGLQRLSDMAAGFILAKSLLFSG